MGIVANLRGLRVSHHCLFCRTILALLFLAVLILFAETAFNPFSYNSYVLL